MQNVQISCFITDIPLFLQPYNSAFEGGKGFNNHFKALLSAVHTQKQNAATLSKIIFKHLGCTKQVEFSIQVKQNIAQHQNGLRPYLHWKKVIFIMGLALTQHGILRNAFKSRIPGKFCKMLSSSLS